MPKLVYHPGLADERTFELAPGTYTIGRAPECDIHVPGKSLSRKHAIVEVSRESAVLVDLQSKNGTFANGLRVERRTLEPGDILRLGELELSFALDGAEPRRPGGDTQSGAATRSPSSHGERVQSSSSQPSLVMSLTRMAFEDLLSAGSEGGALKVRPAAGERRSEDKLRVLLQISEMLSSPADPDALLRKILDLLFQTLDVDRGAVLLVDRESGELVPRVVKSIRDTPEAGPIYSLRIAEYVRRQSVAALFSDAVLDPRLGSSRSIVFQSIRASMCAPLKPKDEVIGVLYVDNLSVPNRFSQEDLEFLAAFANQAAVAIENAALYKRVEAESINRMQIIMQEKLASLANLVAGIAHEIRNPLNFIKNFAEVSAALADEVAQGLAAVRSGERGADAIAELHATLEELRVSAGKIGEHGQRINDIVGRMLSHAQSTSGAREEVDINAVLAESVRASQQVSRGRHPGFNLAVVTDHDPSVGAVEVVVADLRRVFLNVLDNALYAMREKQRAAGAGYAPVLEVATRDRGATVEVRIRDNGPGIPPAILAKVYDPFFTTKPPGEGTGLGLSLAHDIVVRGHQGEMRIESAVDDPGSFAEIVITLPRGRRQPS